MPWGWIRNVSADFGEGRGLARRHLWICYRCRPHSCMGGWVVGFGESVWVGGLQWVFESGEQSFASKMSA